VHLDAVEAGRGRGDRGATEVLGTDVGTYPSAVKDVAPAARSVELTGCPSAWKLEWLIRPTCHSCATILPPSACTASVTVCQPPTCSGLHSPGVHR
jgi:hypothetical protein